MIDGIPLVDAHLHPARLSSLKMPVQEWASGFNSTDGIYDDEGAVIPSAFDAYLEGEEEAHRSRTRDSPSDSTRASWLMASCSGS